MSSCLALFVFFHATATTVIYTLSLHDALPISIERRPRPAQPLLFRGAADQPAEPLRRALAHGLEIDSDRTCGRNGDQHVRSRIADAEMAGRPAQGRPAERRRDEGELARMISADQPPD